MKRWGSIMKAAGFPINTFYSAEDFLNSPHRETTACLILDLSLPDMSGIELQRRLLADNSRMPIIFISGHADASLRDIAMRAGAIDFLSKPVRGDALLKAIRSALATPASPRWQSDVVSKEIVAIARDSLVVGQG